VIELGEDPARDGDQESLADRVYDDVEATLESPDPTGRGKPVEAGRRETAPSAVIVHRFVTPSGGAEGLQEALALLKGLGQSQAPGSWIGGLEVRLRGTDRAQIITVIDARDPGLARNLREVYTRSAG